MKQLRYNATTVIRFEFPAEWDAESLTGLTLTINDNAGAELLAAANATLWTQTTISADADRFASTLTLATGADDLDAGDPILLCGIAGNEIHRVKEYDSANLVPTLERILDNDHDSGDEIWGLFATRSVVTTTVATYPAGKVVTFVWTPTGTGQPVTELYQIAVSALDIEGLQKRFSRLYPRAYESFTKPINRLDDMVIEAELQVRQELLSRGFDIQRLVDSEIIAPVLMAKMAFLWTFDGDEQIKDERDFYAQQYDTQIGVIENLPVWIDQNQDGVDDEGESTTHNHIFQKGW